LNKFKTDVKKFTFKFIAKMKAVFNKFTDGRSTKISVLFNRIIYALIFVICFLYIYFNGGIIPYLLFQLIVILPLLSLLYSFLFVCFFEVSQNISKTEVYKSEEIVFSFALKNKSFLFMPFTRINFYFEKVAFNNCFEAFYTAIFPFFNQPNVFTINCRLTGIFDVGIKSIEIYDLLGIFKFTKKLKQKLEVTTFPRFLSIDDLNAEQSAGFNKATSKKAVYTDPLSIADIRKYSEGDSFRSVHWKLSAKKNELLVKENEKTTDDLALIVVDLYSLEKNREKRLILRDQILEYTVSLLYYCLSSAYTITFVYYGANGQVEISAKDLNDFELIYSNILRLDFTGEIKVSEIVLRLITEMPFKQNLIVISNNINAELDAALVRAHDSGYNTYVYDSSLPIIASDEIKSHEITASLII
jgi:uncharacterized protein (DUF58 family)